MQRPSGSAAWTLEDVKRVFQHYLLLPDGGLVVEILLAAVIANRMNGDPLWLFLVNPPSGVKTELIRSLNGVDDVYPLSNLTPQTFASGFESKKTEPSLLLRLDRHILTLKDFTTVLTMHREKRGEILAQLREIYDGHYRKEFGNGKVVDWTGKIGLIAGVTQVIDTYSSVSQVLGERFLSYRVKSESGAAVAQRAVDNQGKEQEMRQALRGAVAGFLSGVTTQQEIILPSRMVIRIAHLATFCATARSELVRDWKGEVSYIPEPEGPARLAKQLALFGKALALIRGNAEVSEADYVVLYRLAEDTLPRHKLTTLAVLIDAEKSLKTSEVGSKTGYPTDTVRRYLQDLAAMKLVQRMPGGEGKADLWERSDYCVDLLEKAAPNAEVLGEYHPPDASETVGNLSVSETSGGI
jgi:FaeA-like protein